MLNNVFDLLSSLKDALHFTKDGHTYATRGKDRSLANINKKKNATARRRKHTQMRKQLQRNRRKKGLNPCTGN